MTTQTSNQINVNEIGFGIEIETHVPANATPIGHYHNGVQVPWLPSGWKAERDGSIAVPQTRNPRRACEFVSPILKGEAGLAEVKTAVEAIKARGAKVNRSCGVHVTVSFPAGNDKAIKRLINLFTGHERGLYATTGTTRRERGNYARTIKNYGTTEGVEAACKTTNMGARFHGLNLTHVARGRDCIEFRIFSGSLNALKIIAWIKLVLAMAERALTFKRTPPFAPNDARFAPTRRRGEGFGNLTRLFYILGWVENSMADRQYGNIPAPYSHTEIMEVLRDMAKKYDQELTEWRQGYAAQQERLQGAA